jgi:hypothetical protein
MLFFFKLFFSIISIEHNENNTYKISIEHNENNAYKHKCKHLNVGLQEFLL